MFLPEKRIQVSEGALLRSRIPRAYWELKLSNIENAQLQQRLRTLVKTMPQWAGTNEGLLITGPFMTGKTAFAAMLLREAICYGATTYFVRAAEISPQWGRLGSSLEETRTTEMMVKDVDLLVLDDLGAEIGKSERLLEYVLRYRYEDGRCTIVTSNRSSSAMEDFYSPAFLSVLSRACPQTQIIATDQFSRRRKA